MIESLLIRNFRIFEELTFRHFSRVNLIVGKNSIGKSTLLEAIQIYGNKANPKVLYDLIAARDEYWESEIFTRSDQYPLDLGQEDPIRHLFHDYHFPTPESTGIEIGPVASEHPRVLIRPITVKVTEDSEGRRIRIPVTQLTQQELFEAEATLLEPALEIRLGEEKRLFPLSRDPRDRSYRPRGFYPSGEVRVNVQVVPAQNIPEDTLASLWDNINLTDLEQEVTKGLQLINPRVQGVALVGDTRGSSRRRIAIVRCEGQADRIPLKTMGDGMTRIFHIVLALVNAKDGLLLIDEFENGIHWTVQPLLWNTVFRIAEALNVQVFATTHSRDCVSGFFEEWQNKPELGTFHRIDTGSNQEIRVVEYDHEALSDALETQVEIR